MKHTLTLLCALALPLAAPSAFAKLPAPSPEAQAKAADTAARTAWNTKTDAYLLCKAQDQVAAKYRASAQAAGKPAPAAMATPPCVDPGPYAAAPTETKPIEASGAHSPAPTAAAPPSTNQTSAQTNPAPKK
ncbi:hypothetical protein J2W30_002770 [Variovorax boronicumulans]|uniref:hypothetical protein n=1 Tax=Variovorax TaxID=34072 RepID=UPI002780B8F8|nr:MULTISPECIES: hypothetical protein [Variovorax]MDP9996308.1 hypothetical protein [Variovorax boronicumulans]MDQ0007527.1 hypothetical protein [Variovorax boronicumulans]MDQ0035014.1 hypothetical protein [Variovorax boronicumulans]MDQ0039467.1 hypothetical protein [Variovorax boronicumulans]MDQ0609037.1 hypothetical protein [Variovorax sp. W1I1]